MRTESEQVVQRFGSPAASLTRFESHWRGSPAAHGALLRMVARATPDAHCLSIASPPGAVPTTACLIAADQLLVSEAPASAIRHLADHLASTELDVPGIFAPAPAGRRLAEQLQRLGMGRYAEVKRLLHWELRQLRGAPPAHGQPRQATSTDQHALTDLRRAMQAEMNTQRPKDQAAAVQHEIESGQLHMWMSPEGEVASIGTCAIDAAEGRGVIDSIYTPDAHRGRGFATHLTRWLSAKVLATCPVAFLASDARNPAPTRVYEKAGFEVVCEMESYRRVLTS